MLFSVYAPSLRAELAEKDKFYSELRSCLQRTPIDDKAGQDADSWKRVLGWHGVGNCNDNGRLLLEVYPEQQLVITNTIFQQKDGLKKTWMHAWSQYWHLINYVLVHKCNLKHVIYTKVMPSS